MLSVTVADRAEELVDHLAAALAAPGGDPFAPEWVTVPNLGFRSWLRSRLAERLGAGPSGDGIVANVEMPLPGTLRWTLLAAHARHVGLDDGPDPWSVDRLVWAVMAVMADPEAAIDDRLRRDHLPRGVTMASRAGPIADLFDRYGVHRPDMLRAWAAGDDVDSTGAPLRLEQRWQPGLYRAVAAHVTGTGGGAGAAGAVPPPADRLAEAIALVRAGTLSVVDGPDALPGRLFVTGQSIVTAELGPVLAALGTQVDVTVLLLAPSAVEFRRLAEAAPPAPGDATSWGLRRPAGGAPAIDHPLLSGWGRRPLDTATMIGAGGVPVAVSAAPSVAPATLLARVQADLRAGRPPTPPAGATAAESEEPPEPAPTSPATPRLPDDSVQVHAAPGPTRQVEVLRDVLLALLRDHPDLDEADIAVVCPQLDRYAPALAAAWGPSAARGEQPGADEVPSLRYAVVDRDARSFNPVLAAMAAVLEVLPGRFEVSAVRDLLHAPAVRERFGLTDDDLDLLAAMIDHATVRWGIDGPHREPWGIDGTHRANSWASGVDQMMMGIALGEPLIDLVDPADGSTLAVGGLAPMPIREGDIGGAGRVAAALRALAWAHGRLLPTTGGERTIIEWVEVLGEVADHLLAPARFEEWQRARLDAALAEMLIAAGADDPSGVAPTPLTLGDVHRLLRPALDEPRSRADLGFGSIVVARPSLVTGVPFRVVAVLGLDDDALPTRTPSGDDLMIDDERVGDPDRRGDARAALLAALTSARDHLVVTCTSRDIRTNEAVPRAAMLEELVGVVATTAGVAPETVVVDHPRQGFDPRNFHPDRPFGFDPVAAGGARTVLGRRGEPDAGRVRPLLTSPLPTLPPAPVIALEDLLRFFEHPVKAFFRQRLHVSMPRESDDVDDQLPTGLDALQASGIGAELLAVGRQLDDLDALAPDARGRYPREIDELFRLHEATGVLPPGAVGRRLLAGVAAEVTAMLALAESLGVRRVPTSGLDVDVRLDDGTRLVGRVDGLVAGERPGPVRLRYARYKPRYLLAAVIEMLAVAAADPSAGAHAVVVTRAAKSPSTVPVAEVGMLSAGGEDARRTLARAALGDLVAQYRDGLDAPLPLFDKTSHAVVMGNAADAWGDPDDRSYTFGKECFDAHNQLAFGVVGLADLEVASFAGHDLRTEAERLWKELQQTVQIGSPDDVWAAGSEPR